MVFSAVSVGGGGGLFEADDDTILSALGEKKNDSIDAIRSRMKAEQEKTIQHSRFIQTEEQGMVRYFAVSTHTLGPVHLRGEGPGNESFHF